MKEFLETRYVYNENEVKIRLFMIIIKIMKIRLKIHYQDNDHEGFPQIWWPFHEQSKWSWPMIISWSEWLWPEAHQQLDCWANSPDNNEVMF